ncbi:MAG: hypothetical protein AAFW60_04265 [Pseudomonadota bacterium]
MTRVIFIVTDANKPTIEAWAAGDPESEIPAKGFDCIASRPLQAQGDATETTTHWLGSANVSPSELTVLQEAETLGYLASLTTVVDVDTIMGDNGLEPTGFVPEPTPVPKVISAAQAKLVLSATSNPLGGTMLGAVNAYIATLDTEAPARILWETEHNFWRTSALMVTLAAQFGLDDVSLDQMFIAAAELEF